ncbi:putative baseplate protein [Bacillus phage vB_BspM_MarvelLand]|nr:putative baseplate protein [Bacillus phage vB_BspM_MarvelLand]
MVKFRKKIISYGDTMQAIAQQEYGDMARWVELARFNNLRYPYIVDTVDEKMQNPDHLLTVGDALMIRVSEDTEAELISTLKRTNEFDQEEIYALSLGKDLDILPLPKKFGSPGWDSEILELKDDGKGDAKTIRGIENLKQSLYVRLITPMGSYLGHPRYGSKIQEYIGKKNTEENAALLAVEIERTIRTDGRVRSVEKLGHSISGNTFTASFKIFSIALDEAFIFAVRSGESGRLLLDDNFSDTNIR